MTRSRKKRPYVSYYTTKSDKPDKQRVHRQERRAVRQKLQSEPLRDLWPHRKDFGDADEFGKGRKVFVPGLLLKGYAASYDWLRKKLGK